MWISERRHPAMSGHNSCRNHAIFGFEFNSCTNHWHWAFDSMSSYVAHVAICAIYAFSVRALQHWVKSKGNEYKPPQWLEPVRKFHNISLSIVSLWMAVVMIMTMLSDGRFSSFSAVACVNTKNEGLYGIANLIYLVSKIWEWADTYFLVLSSKPVIFLHFFHHMTTFTMAAVVHNFPVGGFCFINCLVHFIMYLHYSYPVRWARPYITSGQLLQFVTVISIHTYGFMNSTNCFNMAPVVSEWLFCEGVVVGYFILFVNFFVQQYLKPGTVKKRVSKAGGGTKNDSSESSLDAPSTPGNLNLIGAKKTN